MIERLADVTIERDGDEFVFRVKSSAALLAALAALALAPGGLKIPALPQAAPIDSGRERATDATHLTRETDEAQGQLFADPMAPDPRSLGAPLRQAAPPAPERAIDPAPRERPIDEAQRKRDAEIAKAYSVEGLSVRQCRQRFSCNQRRIERALEREGVPMRDPSDSAALRWARKRNDSAECEIDASAVEARDADFRRRYVEGRDSVNEIAAATGHSAQIIKSALARLGVPLRSVADSTRIYWERKNAAKLAAAREAIAQGKPAAPKPAAAPPAADRTAKRETSTAPAAIAPKTPPVSTKAAVLTTKTPPAATPTPKPATRLKPDATIDEQIASRYRDDEMPVSELTREFGCGVDAIKSALKRQGVTLRTTAEAIKLSYAKRRQERERDSAIKPRAQPLAIPANAPARSVKLAELNADRGGSAGWNSGPRPRSAGMTVEEQQAAVDRFFQQGGAITRIEAPPIEQVPRPAVGGRDGRR